ncbi:hypothetical protein LMG31506_02229 [Cupriavidus yeoncheonensis]|uniref:Uncharacterized protein n=2 Tax=Cupriavidus yeoncheonensis TaxID=1462994 RepID=A0A916IT28_9BURK|nr:hypothetical protein LMG31506_02229 [Cupriavidus yeoncheonensis]
MARIVAAMAVHGQRKIPAAIFSTRIPSILHDWVIWRAGNRREKAIEQFRAWLQELVRQEAAAAGSAAPGNARMYHS